MRRFVKVTGSVIGLLVLALAAFYGWASFRSVHLLSQPWEAHRVDIPVPWPLTPVELADLRAARTAARTAPTALVSMAGAGEPLQAPDPLADVDLDAIATERARERGERLLEARYACVFCHGDDLAGGVMADDPALGKLLAPNLTMGEGSRTRDYTTADWDRMVRHGIKPDGSGGVMPSSDFFAMSDQELYDLIVTIRARPSVDNVVPGVTLGPVGKVLVATGELPLAASLLPDHQSAHSSTPPSSDDVLAFGAHLTQICVGCHGIGLSGGPIKGGAPDWPPRPGVDGSMGGLSVANVAAPGRLHRLRRTA